jgi:hypothetical protein
MSDLRKAAQALVNQWESNTAYPFGSLVDNLRAALAQPIIPPEIKGDKTQLVVGGDDLPTLTKWTPHRKPLTDQEAKVLWVDVYDPGPHVWVIAERFARAIEKAHGIGP